MRVCAKNAGGAYARGGGAVYLRDTTVLSTKLHGSDMICRSVFGYMNGKAKALDGILCMR